MKKILGLGFLLVALVFAFSVTSYGHGPGGGPGSGYGWGQGRGSGYGHGPGMMGRGFGPGWYRGWHRGPMNFLAQDLKTFTGKVTAVRVEPGFGRFGITVMDLEGKAGKVAVHLGPVGYLKSRKFEVRAGDDAKVVGVPVQVLGKPLFAAKSITVSGKTLLLRDEAGFPLWRGWGRGTPGYGPRMMSPGYGPQMGYPPRN